MNARIEWSIRAVRLRVGNHRVLYSFQGAQRLIIIEAVRKRDEHTY
jgi:mRNA-degrading endonuclease RelE of RelBE toxin-antitoxin system